MARNNSFVNIDWITGSLYLGLVIIGWLMIYAVGYDENATSILDLDSNAGKQAIFILASFVIIFICFLIDGKFWETFFFLVYSFSILLLIAVLIFGSTIKGATSWFNLGGFSLQPSEFAKFGTALAVSGYLSRYTTSLSKPKMVFAVMGLFLVPPVLILLQPDAGSAMVFLAFFIVLFRAGLNPLIYVYALSAATLMVLGLVYNPVLILIGLLIFSNVFLLFNIKRRLGWSLLVGISSLVTLILAFLDNPWPAFGIQALLYIITAYNVIQARKSPLVTQLTGIILIGGFLAVFANYAFNNILESHQQSRINVWLQPSKCDPKGALYNVIQSKLTIGSGGLKGKGFLQGEMTKLDYVPEQATDFIFCTIGEEQGFIGVLGVIGIFFILLWRIINLAERQRSSFSKYFAYSVASILFIHIFINIGMTMGLVPIIGIPLPFISKGGSSILGFSLLIGVMLKLDSVRDGR